MNFLKVSLAALVIVTLLAAGCIEATPGEDTSESPFWVDDTTTASTTTVPPTTMNSDYVSAATPYPTATTVPITAIPTVSQEPEATPVVYPEVFHTSLNLNGGTHAWTVNATYPPLVIDLVITPETEERLIAYHSSYGDRDDVTETVTRVKEGAYMEVTVRDMNGNIVAQDGFNGKYTMGTSKQILVLKGGTYQVDLYGNYVNVDMSVKVGKLDT